MTLANPVVVGVQTPLEDDDRRDKALEAELHRPRIPVDADSDFQLGREAADAEESVSSDEHEVGRRPGHVAHRPAQPRGCGGVEIGAEEFGDVTEDHIEIRITLEARELYALIATLPEAFRDALVAIDLLGLSYREAAQALHVREATITTRLHRGRLRLARALEGKGGDSEDVLKGRAHDWT